MDIKKEPVHTHMHAPARKHVQLLEPQLILRESVKQDTRIPDNHDY